ncbi:MAG: hypothetical protein QM820_56665 [Minicystis sp.]
MKPRWSRSWWAAQVTLTVGAASLVAGGCTEPTKPGPAPAASSAAPATTTTATATTSATAGGNAPQDRELQPVYPVDAGAPDPLAQKFCEAVHILPDKRAAECCGPGGAAAQTMAGQCVRTLSFALAQRAVTLAPADVDQCVEAMTKATAGCDWVTPFGGAVLPPACEGIVKGALAEKAQCRSSLECQGNLRCQGLSTIDLGKCSPPKAVKEPCNLATDMLASFTRQDHVDRDHPECDGYCSRSRCEAAVAEGGACKSDLACGKGRCADGKCANAALPAAGEACSGECAYGARCLKGKCVAPKAEGEACTANEECRGVCDRGDAGAGGHCQKTCPVVRLPILKNVPTATPKRK